MGWLVGGGLGTVAGGGEGGNRGLKRFLHLKPKGPFFVLSGIGSSNEPFIWYCLRFRSVNRAKKGCCIITLLIRGKMEKWIPSFTP